MTAINCFRMPDRGVLMTDAAFYDRDARVVGFGAKAHTIPGIDAALAVRGPQVIAEMLAPRMADLYRDFDDLLDRLEADLFELYEAGRAAMAKDEWLEFELVVVGWSRRENSAKILTFMAAPSLGEEPALNAQALVIGHWYDDAEAENLASLKCRPGADFGPTNFDPEFHGIQVMEAQRRTKELVPSAGGEFHIVGGHVLLTEVRPGAVTHRVIHRWPDRIGEPIQAAPFVKPSAAGRSALALPAKNGVSRAERRRRSKSARAVA